MSRCPPVVVDQAALTPCPMLVISRPPQLITRGFEFTRINELENRKGPRVQNGQHFHAAPPGFGRSGSVFGCPAKIAELCSRTTAAEIKCVQCRRAQVERGLGLREGLAFGEQGDVRLLLIQDSSNVPYRRRRLR